MTTRSLEASLDRYLLRLRQTASTGTPEYATVQRAMPRQSLDTRTAQSARNHCKLEWSLVQAMRREAAVVPWLNWRDCADHLNRIFHITLSENTYRAMLLNEAWVDLAFVPIKDRPRLSVQPDLARVLTAVPARWQSIVLFLWLLLTQARPCTTTRAAVATAL